MIATHARSAGALAGLLLALTASSAHAAPCDIGRPTNDLRESATVPGVFVNPVGRVDSVLLFVDFADAPAGDEQPQAVYDALVSPAVAHLRSVSFGTLTVNVRAHMKWLRMPRGSGSYGFADADGVTLADHIAYYRDALQIADGEVDFAGAEEVLIVSSRDARLPNSPALVAGPDDTRFVFDGQPIGFGVTFGNDIRGGGAPYANAPRVFVHELGHTFGLPDLYRFDGGDIHRDVGPWDPMGNIFRGTAFGAWHRRKLRWLTRSSVTCLERRGGFATVTLAPLDTARGRKLLIIRIDSNRAYTVEVRRPRGTDSGLCGAGVLVSLVDARKPTGAGPIVVQRAAASTSSVFDCGATANAAFTTGGIFTDSGRRVRVQVLAKSGASYRVRARLR